jgi:hypothetical protein
LSPPEPRFSAAERGVQGVLRRWYASGWQMTGSIG